MSNAAHIQCPTCKRRGDWFATPFGPFCSKRCKLIDLGKWLSEEHAISEPLTSEALQRLEELPPEKPFDKPRVDENH